MKAKLVILGQGAIGSLLAARCHHLGMDYGVMTRSGKVTSFRFQPLQSAAVEVSPSLITPEQLRGNEILLLALKAYQILPALEALKPNITEQALLLLHNGMGTVTPTLSLFPQNPLLVGITRMASLKKEDLVTETGAGITDLGWISHKNDARRHADVEQQLSALLAPCKWHQDINPALWMKLAVNAVINPLTALHNIRNGELADPRFASLIQGLCAEIATLMNTLAIEGAKDIEKRVYEVINATATNYSSMHQDIAHGRPTEIDYISGFVVTTAESLGLPAPLNKELWQAVSSRTV
ncbi:2-dehydropantoate 2-reductase [Aliiglaciecola sp. CAU 1673]|uniref:ketopantoate reductase family protein n=1 Tax=Aliiglaciecola sp. CAU 1673 TaxID=3032595 RepID=UPI0023DB6C78|nr:2-dehydropantoate 2-reductase [Aliiglaciecola sp. CAU 1673]MDF2178030.1 2-dehydropantoate 2-reductase [Aliiglaciecola sp. CAU 1673]